MNQKLIFPLHYHMSSKAYSEVFTNPPCFWDARYLYVTFCLFECMCLIVDIFCVYTYVLVHVFVCQFDFMCVTVCIFMCVCILCICAYLHTVSKVQPINQSNMVTPLHTTHQHTFTTLSTSQHSTMQWRKSFHLRARKFFDFYVSA